MPSQFFGLTIAGSGLRASNAALNTTANNIANEQTEGYSRQEVTQQASNALRTFTTYGCAGAGVDTIAIERVRDGFYDVKYWNNNCKYGNYSVKQYYMKTIEDYFKDDGSTGTSGFKTIFDNLSAALQSITTNSSSTTSKAQFISAAKTLTDYFNNMYGNLQELQKDVNLEIKQNVDQINSIAEKISTLNKQINVIEMSGSKANELRDQRELLIDELSEIVDVETTEHDILDSAGGKTGGTRYIVKIGGGQTLVDANDYNSLTYVARAADEKLNLTDVDGLYNIKWENGNDFSLANASLNGKLKGLYELCYGNDKANFSGTVAAVDEANNKVTVSVTDDKLKNLKESMLCQAGGEITIGNVKYLYTDWSFDEAANTYTFQLSDDAARSPQITAGMAGKSVRTSEAIAYQGIPYYMQQMNTWIRGFSEKVNEIFDAGTNAYGDSGTANKGNILFSGYDNVSGKQYTLDELLNGTAQNGYGGYYLLTAGNFSINEALLSEYGGDADLLGTRSSDKVGVEECEQVKEVITLLTSKEKFSFRNASANQMLELILSDIALNASNANTFQTTYEGLKTSIDNQRSSVSGVDKDEEAVSLVKYQNSYTLASKMIQTLTEIYDQLILNTGV